MEPEVLCLQWNEFQTNLRSSFKDLRNSIDFSDVTLVCEDGQRLDAHRVILASFSAFFKDLLLKINQPHPVIFMRALTHATLATMVNFIYLGEAALHTSLVCIEFGHIILLCMHLVFYSIIAMAYHI